MIKLKAIINQIELRNKVIALLTENDIDVSLLDIRALKSYGGDLRVYLTNVERQNKKVSFGEFAAGESEDFMVMNRNYERDEEDDSLISDLSTYIDPSKYNQIFADTSLSAQNFWVQTAVQMEVRRNISAKQIPNL